MKNGRVLRFVQARRDRNCVVLYLAPNRRIHFTIRDPQLAVAALREANRPLKRK